MKRIIIAVAALSVSWAVKAENPIITKEFTADPAPFVYKNKVYIYAGQDEGDGRGYRMPRWRIYSSTDMVNWKDEGSPMQPSDFKWSSGSPDAWAAHMIEKNGKFYWFITCEHRNGGKAIGVAVGNSPTGPFKDAIGKALITPDMTTKKRNHGWEDIDPAVITDDDGVSYIFWGNETCYWAKLKPNMIELDGPINMVPKDEVGGRYTEAPWVHKHNGIYYLSYAYGFPEKTAYSVSKSITGPWKFMGLLAEGAQNCNTMHQGIITFKGKDYFVYHSGMVQYDHDGGNFNPGGSYLRSVCIDYLYYNEDGSIKRVIQTTEGVDRAK